MFNLIPTNNHSLEIIEEVFSLKFSSPMIKTLFRGIKCSIKKLSLHSLDLNISDTQYLMILSEYENDALTHMLYKFLVKSKLIDSIEEIEFELSDLFDCDVLFKLISEYKSKYSPKYAFILSYVLDPGSNIYYSVSKLWIDQIEKHSALNFKKINPEDIEEKLLCKYLAIDDTLEEIKNEFFYEFKENCFSLMSSNKLLMHSLFYKWMRLEFFVYLLEAELTKPNGEITKCSLEPISCKITNDGHLANWKIKENGIEFALAENEEEYEVIQTENLQDELKKLGFNSINVKIPDQFIEELLVEYLEFILFPLIIDQINQEKRKMIDNV